MVILNLSKLFVLIVYFLLHTRYTHAAQTFEQLRVCQHVASMIYDTSEHTSAYLPVSNIKQWQHHVTREVYILVGEGLTNQREEGAGSGGAHMSCQTGLSCAKCFQTHSLTHTYSPPQEQDCTVCARRAQTGSPGEAEETSRDRAGEFPVNDKRN